MKKWNVFAEIKRLKKLGLNKSQVERKLEIDYKTVCKYWDMTPDDFAEALKTSKQRKELVLKYTVLLWCYRTQDTNSLFGLKSLLQAEHLWKLIRKILSSMGVDLKN